MSGRLRQKNELQATPLGSCSILYSDSSFKTLKLDPYYHDRTVAIDNALFAQSQQKTQSNRTLERQSVPVSALTVTISSCLSSPASSSSFPAPHVWIRSEALFQTFQRRNFCSLYSTISWCGRGKWKGQWFQQRVFLWSLCWLHVLAILPDPRWRCRSATCTEQDLCKARIAKHSSGEQHHEIIRIGFMRHQLLKMQSWSWPSLKLGGFMWVHLRWKFLRKGELMILCSQCASAHPGKDHPLPKAWEERTIAHSTRKWFCTKIWNTSRVAKAWKKWPCGRNP